MRSVKCERIAREDFFALKNRAVFVTSGKNEIKRCFLFAFLSLLILWF